jgi:hypothetical protein
MEAFVHGSVVRSAGKRASPLMKIGQRRTRPDAVQPPQFPTRMRHPGLRRLANESATEAYAGAAAHGLAALWRQSPFNDRPGEPLRTGTEKERSL